MRVSDFKVILDKLEQAHSGIVIAFQNHDKPGASLDCVVRVVIAKGQPVGIIEAFDPKDVDKLIKEGQDRGVRVVDTTKFFR